MDPCKCPIARAVHRHKGFGEARIGSHWVGTFSKSYELPKEAKEFIIKFDTKETDLEPFSFYLEVIENDPR